MKPLSGTKLAKNYNLLSAEDQLEVSALVTHKIREFEKSRTGFDSRKTHKAIGRLFFTYRTKRGKRKPMHHIDVELWDKDIGNPDDFLGAGVTDHKGRFEIWYDPDDAGALDTPDLEIRVFERIYKFDSKGQLSFQKRLITSVFGEDNVKALVFDFGDREIPFWEYHPDKLTPRVYIAEEGGPPQSYSPGRSLEMVKALASIEAIKRKHIFMCNNNPKSISANKVQKDYPINLTRKLEKEMHGSTRSDEYFGNLFLNGMEASVLDKDPNNPDQYWIHHHWNSYEQDGIYAMPNVDILFQLEGEKLMPLEITLAMRNKGVKPAHAKTKKVTVKRDEGKKWKQAKRIARVSAALVAEVDSHLCSTHLNAEQYAISAYRNIRYNPVRHLIFPHIKEVCLINYSADSLLLGEEGYITKATAFTEESLNQRIFQVLGTQDWKDWKPRKIISDNHTYAKAAWMYWVAIGDHVDNYFELFDEGIRKHWIEIKMFSKELVDNSVPIFLCNFLNGQLATPGNAPWFEWNERMDASKRHEEVDGQLRAVSSITKHEVPSENDISNLKQVCRYIIYQTTFAHWWSNSRQYDEGGELKFTALGMRYGDHGLFTPESDTSVLPPPREATMQLWISYMLSYTKYGLILRNEDTDIHPYLIEKVLELKDPFEELGLDISSIPSRTNI